MAGGIGRGATRRKEGINAEDPGEEPLRLHSGQAEATEKTSLRAQHMSLGLCRPLRHPQKFRVNPQHAPANMFEAAVRLCGRLRADPCCGGLPGPRSGL
jgi:hypothetical protein